MKLRKIFAWILLVFFITGTSCKVKRCASFENQDKEFKLKYDRNGRIRR